MKFRHLLILSGALLPLAFAASLRAMDNVVIDPTTGTDPARLTLKGPVAIVGGNPVVGGNSGFTISHVDDSGATFGLNQPVSIGKFVLLRPVGFYQWNFSEWSGAERPAMELSNNHSLVLRSSYQNERDADPEINAIELRPGPNGGVFYNNNRLPTSGDLGVAYAGGSLVHPANGPAIPPGSVWWASRDGTMAVGDGAVAWGWGSFALGNNATAGIGNAIALGCNASAQSQGSALGLYAYADTAGTALGNYSYALNHGVAIGAGSFALGYYSYAYGPNSFCYGSNSMAFGYSHTGNVWDCVAINGLAWAAQSFACAWGSAEGETSIAIGGDAQGYKSFAAASGVSLGHYSITIGRGTVAQQHYQVVLGEFNAYLNTPSDSPAGPTDPIFVIGNGWVENDNTPQYSEHRSNAFTVGHDGAAWVQGGITVEGGSVASPAPSVFKSDVSVQGVLRVPQSGDLDMGVFTQGAQP